MQLTRYGALHLCIDVHVSGSQYVSDQFLLRISFRQRTPNTLTVYRYTSITIAKLSVIILMAIRKSYTKME
mgnify:FL=1